MTLTLTPPSHMLGLQAAPPIQAQAVLGTDRASCLLGRLSTSRATAAALNCLLPKDQEPAVKREISIYLNLAGLTTTSKTDPEVCL